MKKSHKNFSKSLTRKNHYLKFGDIGIKILSSIFIDFNQLSLLKKSLDKKVKTLNNFSKKSKFWTLICLNKSITKLSLESRMGKGKGNIYSTGVFLKGGSVLFEFSNIKHPQSDDLLKFIKKKIPSTKIVLVQNTIKERVT